MKKLFKSIGWALLYIAVYLGASIAIGVMLAFVIIFAAILKDPNIIHNYDRFNNLIYKDIGQYSNLIVIITSILSFFIFLFIYKGRRKSIFKICNFSRISIKNIGLIVLLGAAFNIFVDYIMTYITQLPALDRAVKSYEEISKLISGGNFILSLLAVVLVAPFFEEIFFRGIVFNEMKNGMPLAVALIIQAIIFGVFHGNLIQGSYAFLLGLLLCLVYIWFKSIWVNIAFHLSFNLTAVFTDYIPNRFGEGSYAIVITIASGLVALSLLFIVYRRRVKPDIAKPGNIVV